MAVKNARNFSQDLKDQVTVADHIEVIQHPLVKQVIAQVLAEKSIDKSYGSTFGEGGGG